MTNSCPKAGNAVGHDCQVRNQFYDRSHVIYGALYLIWTFKLILCRKLLPNRLNRWLTSNIRPGLMIWSHIHRPNWSEFKWWGGKTFVKTAFIMASYSDVSFLFFSRFSGIFSPALVIIFLGVLPAMSKLVSFEEVFATNTSISSGFKRRGASFGQKWRR